MRFTGERELHLLQDRLVEKLVDRLHGIERWSRDLLRPLVNMKCAKFLSLRLRNLHILSCSEKSAWFLLVGYQSELRKSGNKQSTLGILCCQVGPLSTQRGKSDLYNCPFKRHQLASCSPSTHRVVCPRQLEAYLRYLHRVQSSR